MAATGTEHCHAEPGPNEEKPALPRESGLESQTETSTGVNLLVISSSPYPNVS